MTTKLKKAFFSAPFVKGQNDILKDVIARFAWPFPSLAGDRWGGYEFGCLFVEALESPEGLQPLRDRVGVLGAEGYPGEILSTFNKKGELVRLEAVPFVGDRSIVAKPFGGGFDGYYFHEWWVVEVKYNRPSAFAAQGVIDLIEKIRSGEKKEKLWFQWEPEFVEEEDDDEGVYVSD